MICAKHLVYSFEIGLLHEAREREARGRTGPGIYAMSLAICVHARVEIGRTCMSKTTYITLQSVYMRELKFKRQYGSDR